MTVFAIQTVFLHLTAGWLHPPLPAVHDFKLSVCEIRYEDSLHTYALKFYLFQDDLKAAIYDDPTAPTLSESDVADYIRQHFSFRPDGESVPMQYESMKEKNDQVLVRFTVGGPERATYRHLSIQNTILVEKFRQQSNMVYLYLPGREKATQLFDSRRTVWQYDL
ncbi:MAG: hypothetical protein RLY31_295 [Bacteroidota bacterium]|jgi:hypothetical protein